LAPLRARRDIALLGVVHRAVLGKWPAELREFLKVTAAEPHRRGLRSSSRRHSRTLVDCCEGLTQDYCLRSALSLPPVYNMLPGYIVSADSVSSFQNRLQKLLLHSAQSGVESWDLLFSTRVSWLNHSLRRAPSTCPF